MSFFFQQSIFILRLRYYAKIKSFFRKVWLISAGMEISKGTIVSKIYITWPHQVSLGENCVLEHSIYFKYDGIWRKGPSIVIKDNVFIGTNCEFNIRKRIEIGNNSLIASGCRFIDHDHGTALNELMRKQPGLEKEIILGEDVWIGCNCIILKGVVIGTGAIIAAGALVNKSVPPNEIWAGVPARKIGDRNNQ